MLQQVLKPQSMHSDRNQPRKSDDGKDPLLVSVNAELVSYLNSNVGGKTMANICVHALILGTREMLPYTAKGIFSHVTRGRDLKNGDYPKPQQITWVIKSENKMGARCPTNIYDSVWAWGLRRLLSYWQENPITGYRSRARMSLSSTSHLCV